MQPGPFTLQVTAGFEVPPVTVAVNSWLLLTASCNVAGDILMTTGGRIVTETDAAFEGLAFEVAVTITCAGLGGAAGAVYKPVEEMVPQPDPVQPRPLTLQATDVFVLPVTVAVNCWVFPEIT